VLTDTAHSPTHARNFVLRFAALSLGIFGLLRLNWIETNGVLPVTQWQGQLAARMSGTPILPVDVTVACSGTDVLALCLGAILAYPVPWRMRVGGAGIGVALILALNTIRIGTLARAVASPPLFEALHVFVWPALLTLAVAGYVFGWMRFIDGRGKEAPTKHRRFVTLTAAFLVVFIAASSLYLESKAVLAIAAFIARAAALGLGVFGVQATAAGHALLTSQGGFLVTQECISTPLIPVYFAAVCTYSRTWLRGMLAVLAAVPLFVGLGIARLLIVALPPAVIVSPIFLVHAFYQLLLAAVVIFFAAFWRHGAGSTAWRRALLGGALGGIVVYLAGPPYARALAWMFSAGTTLDDPQGAIALLPAFQAGLYVALSVAAFAVFTWRPFVVGLALLAFSQIAAFAAMHFVVRHAGFAPHVRDVRGWAIAIPLLVAAAVVNYAQPRR